MMLYVSGQGQLTVKGSSNRMLPRFQEPILGSIRFEKHFTVNCTWSYVSFAYETYFKLHLIYIFSTFDVKHFTVLKFFRKIYLCYRKKTVILCKIDLIYCAYCIVFPFPYKCCIKFEFIELCRYANVHDILWIK